MAWPWEPNPFLGRLQHPALRFTTGLLITVSPAMDVCWKHSALVDLLGMLHIMLHASSCVFMLLHGMTSINAHRFPPCSVEVQREQWDEMLEKKAGLQLKQCLQCLQCVQCPQCSAARVTCWRLPSEPKPDLKAEPCSPESQRWAQCGHLADLVRVTFLEN